MTLSELIDLLKDIQDRFPDEDPEVRLAMQPAWAFEYSIHSLTCLEDSEGEEEGEGEGEGEDAPVVYLSEGVQLGYLPAAVKDVAW